MWAAFDTDNAFVLFTDFIIASFTFWLAQASSDVFKSSPVSFLIQFFASAVKFYEGKPVVISMSTLRVIRALMNLLFSPTSIILLHAGHYSLKLSSIGTGATFSPPAVMISSFIRPVILRYPPLSILPWSPVLKYPNSSIHSLVAYSFFKYPIITCLPATLISPCPFSS